MPGLTIICTDAGNSFIEQEDKMPGLTIIAKEINKKKEAGVEEGVSNEWRKHKCHEKKLKFPERN